MCANCQKKDILQLDKKLGRLKGEKREFKFLGQILNRKLIYIFAGAAICQKQVILELTRHVYKTLKRYLDFGQ